MEIEDLNNNISKGYKIIYYNLYHVYEKEDDEIDKFIGVFESKEDIEKVIDALISQNGFKDYPRDCFEIHECMLNQYGWRTGFIPVKDFY